MNAIIINLFKILNLLLVISVVIYLVRRYGVLYIMQMIREEKQQEASLKKHHKNLNQDFEDLQVATDAQEQEFIQLEKKFTAWSDAISAKRTEQQQQQAIQQEAMKQKRLQQLQHLQKKLLIKKQGPQLLQEVTQDLSDYFASAKHKEQYITNIMKNIKE